MPKREPEFYEPSSPEEIRVFDGADEDLDEEGSRLPLLLVVALIMVFAFGAVVWFAYTQGVQTGRSGPPQLIKAPSGPVRTAPAHPGGVTPFEGLKIYEHPAAGSSTGSQSAQATPGAPGVPGGTTTTPASRVATAKPQALTSLVPPPVSKPATAVQQVKPGAGVRAQGTPLPLHTKSTKVAQRAPTRPLAKRPPLARPAGAGHWMLQIGAYKSRAQAAGAWRIYARRHAAAAALSHDILRVDLGAKGLWYRLRIGSYTSRMDATRACNQLKADGAACFPAKG